MKYLSLLQETRFAIWPFDHATTRVGVEIYPWLFTGPINKSDRRQHEDYQSRPEFQKLPKEWCDIAASCEDAFDAAISAFRMHQHATEIRSLRRTTDSELLLEGMIWHPNSVN